MEEDGADGGPADGTGAAGFAQGPLYGQDSPSPLDISQIIGSAASHGFHPIDLLTQARTRWLKTTEVRSVASAHISRHISQLPKSSFLNEEHMSDICIGNLCRFWICCATIEPADSFLPRRRRTDLQARRSFCKCPLSRARERRLVLAQGSFGADVSSAHGLRTTAPFLTPRSVLLSLRTALFSSSAAGTLWLFDRKAVRFFRRDGHNWQRKRDGKTIRETHEKLKARSHPFLPSVGVAIQGTPFLTGAPWVPSSAGGHRRDAQLLLCPQRGRQPLPAAMLLAALRRRGALRFPLQPPIHPQTLRHLLRTQSSSRTTLNRTTSPTGRDRPRPLSSRA